MGRRPGRLRTRRETPLHRLEALDDRESGYYDLAADGLMPRNRLQEKLAALEDEREAIRNELAATRDRASRVRELEDLKDSLWLWWGDAANVMGFEDATPEERHDAYRRYRIEVVAQPGGGVYMTGAFGGEPFFGLSETSPP